MIETETRELVQETSHPINTRLTGRQKVGLTLFGIVAVALTGFLGYPSAVSGEPPVLLFLDMLFAKSWLLFAWFLAFIMALEGAMVWKPKQRQQLQQARIAIVVGAGLAAVLDLFWDQIIRGVGGVVGYHPLERLASQWWFYATVDLVVVIALVADAVRRLNRRRRGLPPNPVYDRTTGELKTVPVQQLPTLPDVISGDVLVRAFVVLMLALVFTPTAVAWTLLRLLPDMPIHVPGLDNPGAPHLQPFTPASVVVPGSSLSLTLLNVLLGFAAAAGGLVTAGMLAQGAGMEVIAKYPLGSAVRAKPGWYLVRIGQRFASTLVELLTHPLQRLLSLPWRVLESLRALIWPCMTIIGVFTTGELSKAIQTALHRPYNANVSSPTLFNHPLQWVAGGAMHFMGFVYPMLVLGVASLFFIVAAASVQLKDERVASEAARFLFSLSFLAFLGFCIYSTALWVINLVLLLLLTYRYSDPLHLYPPAQLVPYDYRLHPFTPGVITILSALTVLTFALTLLPRLIRRMRRRKR